jgi:hypothetical protein
MCHTCPSLSHTTAVRTQALYYFDISTVQDNKRAHSATFIAREILDSHPSFLHAFKGARTPRRPTTYSHSRDIVGQNVAPAGPASLPNTSADATRGHMIEVFRKKTGVMSNLKDRAGIWRILCVSHCIFCTIPSLWTRIGMTVTIVYGTSNPLQYHSKSNEPFSPPSETQRSTSARPFTYCQDFILRNHLHLCVFYDQSKSFETQFFFTNLQVH